MLLINPFYNQTAPPLKYLTGFGAIIFTVSYYFWRHLAQLSAW
jgi:hypothetical protein